MEIRIVKRSLQPLREDHLNFTLLRKISSSTTPGGPTGGVGGSGGCDDGRGIGSG